jgi:hypothetical protein
MEKRERQSIKKYLCGLGIMSALVALSLCVALSAQSAPNAQHASTFHIEGTITTPWDSLPAGVVVPREGGDAKSDFVPLARTEITFRGEQTTKTVTVNNKGFYKADLPPGFYKMTAHGPAIGPQELTHYVRIFYVGEPRNVVLNGTLYMARMNCDDVVDPNDTQQEQLEQRKDDCGGDDYFSFPSKDEMPFEIYVRYPRRQPTRHGYNYISTPQTPVMVAYNLFSLQASAVSYDTKNRVVIATGNVLMEDGSGTKQHEDAIRLRFENGKVVKLSI